MRREGYTLTQAALLTTACLLTSVSPANGKSCPNSGPPSDAQWRLTASLPPGCNGAACSYFLGIRTNEDPLFLDFMVEGNAQGWIAVGYTPNRGMPDADVFVCALIGGQVTILDTYDVANAKSNVVDSIQDLCPFNMSFVNGRIRCVFSRAIQTNDVIQDKPLNQSYYQLMGRTNTLGSTSSLIAHHGVSSTPAISGDKVNPANTSMLLQLPASSGLMVASITIALVVSSAAPQIDRLIRAHGILMVVAWPVLAVLGIFFAAWMKPALPGAEWFQVHRALLLASLFFGGVAFACSFIGKRDTKGLVSFVDPTTTAHFAIGIIVMALHILNPIVSAFRCLPTSPRRWIFNLIHGTCIGLGVEMLALANVGIGLALFGNKLNMASPLAVYLAYVAFLLLLIGALFVVFTVVAIKSGSPPLAPAVLKPLLARFASSSPAPTSTKVEVDMTKGDKPNDPPQGTAGGNDPPPKPPSKDAPLRWVGLTALLVVMVPLMLTVIILIAAL